jgi:hypothetical protein
MASGSLHETHRTEKEGLFILSGLKFRAVMYLSNKSQNPKSNRITVLLFQLVHGPSYILDVVDASLPVVYLLTTAINAIQ